MIICCTNKVMIGLPLNLLNDRLSRPHCCADTTIYNIESTANQSRYCFGLNDCSERNPFVKALSHLDVLASV